MNKNIGKRKKLAATIFMATLFLTGPAAAQSYSFEWSDTATSSYMRSTHANDGYIGVGTGTSQAKIYDTSGNLVTDQTYGSEILFVIPFNNGEMIYNDAGTVYKSSDLTFGGDTQITTGITKKADYKVINGSYHFILSEGFNGDAKLYDAGTDTVTNVPVPDADGAAQIELSDDTFAYVSPGKSTFEVADFSGNLIGTPLTSVDDGDLADSITARDGEFIASSFNGDDIRIVDADTATETKSFDIPGYNSNNFPALGIAVSGTTLMTLSKSSSARYVVAMDTQTETIQFEGTRDVGTNTVQQGAITEKLYSAGTETTNVVSYSLPNTPPKVNLSLIPEVPQYQDSVDVNVSSSDTDGISSLNVSAYRDGNLINNTVVSNSSVYLNDFLTAEIGDYNVTATATDSFGGSTTESENFSIVDNPPVISNITTDPPIGTWIYGNVLDVEANITDVVSDVDSASVVLLVNGNPQTGNISLNKQGGTEIWRKNNFGEITQRAENWTVKVYATDTNGNTGSEKVTQYVEDLRPKLIALEIKRNYFDYGVGDFGDYVKLIFLGLITVFIAVIAFK